MYRHHGQLWPQSEPITGREVCWFCWNQDHKHCGLMHDEFNRIQCDHLLEYMRQKGSADGFRPCGCEHECDCYCRLEAGYVDNKRAQRLAHGRERRKLVRSLRDAENNSLRAVNPEWKPPMRGKKPVS